MKKQLAEPNNGDEKRTNQGSHDDPDTVEIDESMIAEAHPASESRPQLVAAYGKGRGERGVQKTPTKERITIRLSPEVVERFRATGAGWQTRIDSALKDWLKNHRP